MWSRYFLAIVLSAVTSLSALALERPFPPGVKRGVMTPAPHPYIVIDGSTRELAPGARIWNQDNMIEMPASLRGSTLPVHYTEDVQGAVDRVWILTETEARRPAPRKP